MLQTRSNGKAGKRASVKGRPVGKERASASKVTQDAEFSLPPAFWARFVKQHTGRRPYILKRACAPQPLTSEEAFRATVQVGEQYRAGGQKPSVRFYVEHALLQADKGEHLPRPSDRSLEAYAERIRRELKGRKFGLVIDKYQAHDAKFYLRLRDFLRGLHEFTGIPAYSIDATLFLGDYESSPFGLHYDAGMTSITFVLAGRKRLLVWPPDFFPERRNNTLDYEHFRDEALTLEGETGDLFCCPANYWHAAESDGDLTITLAVGYLNSPEMARRQALNPVLRLIEQRLSRTNDLNPRPFDLNVLNESAGRLPQVCAKAGQAMGNLSGEAEFEETLHVAWLNQLSGFNINGVPPPLPRQALADDDLVCGDPHYPVLWLAGVGDEIICSANGHAFSVTAHPNVPGLLERLNGGAACRVRNLIQECAGTVRVGDVEFVATPKDIRAIMEKLHSLRAITRGCRG